MEPTPNQAQAQDSLKTITLVVYALQAAGFVVGLTFIVAVVINYVKREDVVGTLYESHFRWQIRTFWYGLLWGVLGAILMFVVIGWFVLCANFVWVIYRIVKGWLRVVENKPMYVTTVAR
jgi:uncharacterized membrane protein